MRFNRVSLTHLLQSLIQSQLFNEIWLFGNEASGNNAAERLRRRLPLLPQQLPEKKNFKFLF